MLHRLIVDTFCGLMAWMLTYVNGTIYSGFDDQFVQLLGEPCSCVEVREASDTVFT